MATVSVRVVAKVRVVWLRIEPMQWHRLGSVQWLGPAQGLDQEIKQYS